MRGGIALLAAAAALAVPAVSAGAVLDRCTFGMETEELPGFLPAAVEEAAEEYAASLDADAATRERARKIFAAGAAAYVYGLPQVSIRATVKRFGHNVIISIAKLATPAVKTVVAPNNDTTYSVGWFDLTTGPLVIDVPDTGGRYYTLQLVDAWTNAFAYIGHRSTGTRAGSYALVPPGWTGTLPAGVKRIDSPSYTVFLIGRTLVDGEADMPEAKRVMQQYAVTPLEAWSADTRQPSVVLDDFPPTQNALNVPTGKAFIDALNRSLRIDPAPAAERCALEQMAPAGVQTPAAYDQADALAAIAADQGRPRESSDSDPVTDAALRAATEAGAKIVQRGADTVIADNSAENNGWLVLAGWIGRYEQRYLGRAAVAKVGLGANTAEEAVYPVASTDGDGQPLDGTNRYTMRFEQGALPPVDAFWSLTMYGADYFMYENEIRRYSIGDRTSGLRTARDGSLTLAIQHQAPSDPTERANWLPAPPGPFRMMMRLYEPKASVLGGAWKPPPIERVGAPPRLGELRVAPKRFRRRARVSYTVNQAARTTLTVRRRVRGREDAVMRRLTHDGALGANRLWLRRRSLAPGLYVLTGVAHGAGGAASRPVSVTFRVRR